MQPQISQSGREGPVSYLNRLFESRPRVIRGLFDRRLRHRGHGDERPLFVNIGMPITAKETEITPFRA